MPWPRHALLVFFAFLLLLAMVALSGPGRAHGDAAWIQHGEYLAASGQHCCGVADCERMPPDVRARLKPTTKGWEIDGVTFLYGRPSGTPRCLFEPQMGS